MVEDAFDKEYLVELEKDKLFQSVEKRFGKVDWEFLGTSFNDDNKEVVLFVNKTGDSAFRYILNREDEYFLEDYPWYKD